MNSILTSQQKVESFFKNRGYTSKRQATAEVEAPPNRGRKAVSVFIPRTRVDPRLIYLGSKEGRAKVEALLGDMEGGGRHEYAAAQESAWLSEPAEVREHYEEAAAQRREEMDGNQMETFRCVLAQTGNQGLTSVLHQQASGVTIGRCEWRVRKVTGRWARSTGIGVLLRRSRVISGWASAHCGR